MEQETKRPSPAPRRAVSVPRLILHAFVLAYSIYGIWDGMRHGPTWRPIMFAVVGFLALVVLVVSLRQPPVRR